MATATNSSTAPASMSRSRFGNFMQAQAAASSNTASSGISPSIWGLNAGASESGLNDNETLRGSSSLEHSSVPDNTFARPSSSSAAWNGNVASSFGGLSGSGTISPLRQRTAQNTRSSSPFMSQNGMGAGSHTRLNPETRTFDPGNTYNDYLGGSAAASRASSTSRNGSTARSTFGANDLNFALNSFNNQSASRNGSYPASRHGHEISPTNQVFDPNDLNERLPRSGVFDQMDTPSDRPQSQGQNLPMMFGSVPADRRPSGPYLKASLGGFDGTIANRSSRASSASSNMGPSFGMMNQGGLYRQMSQLSNADLQAFEDLSLSVSMQDNFPVLRGEIPRNGPGQSNVQSNNPTYNLNQLRQNRGGFNQNFQQPRRTRHGSSSYSYGQDQHRNQPSLQAAQFGAYGDQTQYWSGQAGGAQGGAAQQAYYTQDSQSRNHYSQATTTQVPRGPARGGRAVRAGDMSPLGQAAIKEQGNNWAHKEKPNGTSIIEINQACTVKDVLTHVALFCGDQQGSRWIQERVVDASAEDKEKMFGEVLVDTIALCMDPFGNYVIQKFFEYGTQRQKSQMAGKMKGKIHDLSKHAYGCRCVQKAFEHILRQQRLELVDELKPCLLEVAKDQHGNHVVQKVLQNMDTTDVQFVLNGFEGQVLVMSNDPYACRVIQRLLEYGDEHSKPRISAEIIRHADILMRNPYGNYVVQHVVERGTPEDRAAIVALVEPAISELMINKFASNVVERCLEHGTKEHRDLLVAKIGEVDPKTGLPRHLREAMTAPYGNYVVQRTLKTLPPGKWEPFAELVKSQMQYLIRDNGHNKKYIEFERLLKQGPYIDGEKPLRRARETVATFPPRVNTDAGSTGTGTPPPLTRTQPSPQSSSAPSTSNSMIDGPTGSVDSASGSNKSEETAVGRTTAGVDTNGSVQV